MTLPANLEAAVVPAAAGDGGAGEPHATQRGGVVGRRTWIREFHLDRILPEPRIPADLKTDEPHPVQILQLRDGAVDDEALGERIDGDRAAGREHALCETERFAGATHCKLQFRRGRRHTTLHRRAPGLDQHADTGFEAAFAANAPPLDLAQQRGEFRRGLAATGGDQLRQLGRRIVRAVDRGQPGDLVEDQPLGETGALRIGSLDHQQAAGAEHAFAREAERRRRLAGRGSDCHEGQEQGGAEWAQQGRYCRGGPEGSGGARRGMQQACLVACARCHGAQRALDRSTGAFLGTLASHSTGE
ncbi:MAG: hypothetical protein K8J09_07410 [Planctomycetes bacterium]|nr:hypothetical protein [Planctomycetota bacterium]